MVIGICELCLRFPGSGSLKEKRSVLKSLLARIRQRYNVSVAETGQQDKWQLATVTFACVSGDAASAHRLLEQVAAYVEGDSNILVVNMSLQIV